MKNKSTEATKTKPTSSLIKKPTFDDDDDDDDDEDDAENDIQAEYETSIDYESDNDEDVLESMYDNDVSINYIIIKSISLF